MALSSGTRLGPYEILSPLGAGGMGEVYRARDTRLEREVAVKVLPPHLSSSEEMRQRFEREAKAISQLSHPHICALYDVGSHEGTEYLVMELLEGETLAARLVKGALPIEQTLRFGVEIVDALDKAHRQGIVHRDLKPGNVMLTKSGVKLLDFGLAKVLDPKGPVESLTSVPTAAKDVTEAGAILGTLSYMAPEQLEGKKADSRTDIFAFGATLYEMATGRKAFSGSGRASLISSIMTTEPQPISTLQPMTPPALDRVVRKCLAKDPEERWQNAADLGSELRWVSEGASQTGIAAPAVSGPRRRSWLPWAAALLLSGLAVALSSFFRAPAPAPVLRAAINLPPKTVLEPLGTALALSPDGLRLAFSATGSDGKLRLWLRSMDALEVQPFAGTDGATCPFWSPDSRFIGFFADRKLKKIPASGGTVLTICDAPDGRGATWGGDDVIVFAPAPFVGLSRVSASGGSPTVLTQVQGPGATHRLPHFLPDGKHVLFLSGTNSLDKKDTAIYALDLDSKKTTLVARENSEGRYAEPGFLVFFRDGNLMAQPMDAGRLRTSGAAIPIAERVHFYQARFSGNFSFSRNGLLVVQTGSAGQKRQLTWFDVDGKSLGTLGEPAAFRRIAIAPDGRHAAAAMFGATVQSNIWMYDLARGVASPFTSGNLQTLDPTWSADGRLVAYDRLGESVLVKSVDGFSEPKTLAFGLANSVPTSWSPDGRFIALRVQDLKTGGMDIWLAPVDGSRKPYPFLATPANEGAGKFSPDGRWFSYLSDDSGRPELYVVPFPGPGEKRQISTGGAEFSLALQVSFPLQGGFWLGDGRQIAYLSPDRKLIAVDVRFQGATLEIGGSHPLFGGRPLPEGPFDVTHDGKRILVAVAVDENISSQLTLVTNWAAEIQKK